MFVLLVCIAVATIPVTNHTMGVVKLWTTVAPLTNKLSFWEAMNGKVSGEDAYVWLHQLASVGDVALGLLQCEFKTIEKNFLSRLLRMTSHGVTPIFVFDASKEAGTGAKAEENKRRAETRTAARQTALALLRTGDRVGAGKAAVKAVAITDTLVYRIIHNILIPHGIGTFPCRVCHYCTVVPSPCVLHS